MTYTYTAIFVEHNKEFSFFFYELPSGILTIEKGEEPQEMMEECLMELLSDEDFLPHDLLPNHVHPDEKQVKSLVERIYCVSYDSLHVETRDITVSED